MTETEEKHNAPTIVEDMSAGKTTGCMYSRKYTTPRPYAYVNSEDRSTTASSSSYARETSCYPEQPYGGEHYWEGLQLQHGGVGRSGLLSD